MDFGFAKRVKSRLGAAQMEGEIKLLKTFRLTAFWEGVSFVVLLLIAMPLKYIGGIEEAVKVVGWAHGILFMAYCYFLFQVAGEFKWSAKRSLITFVAALVPLAPFWVDRKVKREEEQLSSLGS